MNSASILAKISSGVGWLTLNRPEVFNSFNREMALKLQGILVLLYVKLNIISNCEDFFKNLLPRIIFRTAANLLT